jgi:hypothetical protein
VRHIRARTRRGAGPQPHQRQMRTHWLPGQVPARCPPRTPRVSGAPSPAPSTPEPRATLAQDETAIALVRHRSVTRYVMVYATDVGEARRGRMRKSERRSLPDGAARRTRWQDRACHGVKQGLGYAPKAGPRRTPAPFWQGPCVAGWNRGRVRCSSRFALWHSEPVPCSTLFQWLKLSLAWARRRDGSASWVTMSKSDFSTGGNRGRFGAHSGRRCRYL